MIAQIVCIGFCLMILCILVATRWNCLRPINSRARDPIDQRRTMHARINAEERALDMAETVWDDPPLPRPPRAAAAAQARVGRPGGMGPEIDYTGSTGSPRPFHPESAPCSDMGPIWYPQYASPSSMGASAVAPAPAHEWDIPDRAREVLEQTGITTERLVMHGHYYTLVSIADTVNPEHCRAFIREIQMKAAQQGEGSSDYKFVYCNTVLDPLISISEVQEIYWHRQTNRHKDLIAQVRSIPVHVMGGPSFLMQVPPPPLLDPGEASWV